MTDQEAADLIAYMTQRLIEQKEKEAAWERRNEASKHKVIEHKEHKCPPGRKATERKHRRRLRYATFRVQDVPDQIIRENTKPILIPGSEPREAKTIEDYTRLAKRFRDQASKIDGDTIRKRSIQGHYIDCEEECRARIKDIEADSGPVPPTEK